MRLVILALALVAGAGAAHAQDTTVATRVFAQVVAYPLPAGFAPAFEDTDGSFYIQESVPAGESVNNWSQMLTLTAAQGQAGVDPLTYAQQIAGGYASACPGSFGATELPAPTIPGARATFAAHLGCGNVNGQGYAEEMMLFVLAGDTDLYTLQWAARSAAQAQAPQPTPAIWMPRWQVMADGARLCDPVAGEGAPFPSCSAGG